MKPGEHNFTIYQGTTWRASVVWKDDQDPPQPRDLTGYTARMQIRPGGSRETQDAPLIELTTENGGLEIISLIGRIDLLLTDAQTSALDFNPQPGFVVGSGVYDLELESPAGEVVRLVQGTVTLDPEVTR